MYKHAAPRVKPRLPVAGTENGKLRFSESCICIHATRSHSQVVKYRRFVTALGVGERVDSREGQGEGGSSHKEMGDSSGARLRGVSGVALASPDI